MADLNDERAALLIELVKDLDYQMGRLMVWERRLPNVLRNAFLAAGINLPDRVRGAPNRRHADGGPRLPKPGRQVEDDDMEEALPDP